MFQCNYFNRVIVVFLKSFTLRWITWKGFIVAVIYCYAWTLPEVSFYSYIWINFSDYFFARFLLWANIWCWPFPESFKMQKLKWCFALLYFPFSNDAVSYKKTVDMKKSFYFYANKNVITKKKYTENWLQYSSVTGNIRHLCFFFYRKKMYWI